MIFDVVMSKTNAKAKADLNSLKCHFFIYLSIIGELLTNLKEIEAHNNNIRLTIIFN